MPSEQKKTYNIGMMITTHGHYTALYQILSYTVLFPIHVTAKYDHSRWKKQEHKTNHIIYEFK